MLPSLGYLGASLFYTMDDIASIPLHMKTSLQRLKILARHQEFMVSQPHLPC